MRYTNIKIFIQYTGHDGTDLADVITVQQSVDRRKLRRMLFKYILAKYNKRVSKLYLSDLIRISNIVYQDAPQLSEDDKALIAREWIKMLYEEQDDETQAEGS